jgi:hypothetical protein
MGSGGEREGRGVWYVTGGERGVVCGRRGEEGCDRRGERGVYVCERAGGQSPLLSAMFPVVSLLVSSDNEGAGVAEGVVKATVGGSRIGVW